MCIRDRHVIWPCGQQPVSSTGGLSESLPFAELGNSKALLAPQTLDFLAVQSPSLADQHGVCPPVPPPGMGGSQDTETSPELSVTVRIAWSVALG